MLRCGGGVLQWPAVSSFAVVGACSCAVAGTPRRGSSSSPSPSSSSPSDLQPLLPLLSDLQPLLAGLLPLS